MLKVIIGYAGFVIGQPIKLHRFKLYMFGIPDIYHYGSLTFSGIAIAAKGETTAIMPWIMIHNTSKAVETQH